MIPQWISDVISVAPWLGAIVVCVFFGIKIGRFLAPLFREIRNFLDDWNGEPPRPGVKGRDGVMARLGAIEHEVRPNTGSSMKDGVGRLENNLSAMGKKLDAHIAACPPAPATTITVNQQGGA